MYPGMVNLNPKLTPNLTLILGTFEPKLYGGNIIKSLIKSWWLKSAPKVAKRNTRQRSARLGILPNVSKKKNNQTTNRPNWPMTNEPFLCYQRERHCCACIGQAGKEGAHSESERSVPSLA
jgi:hypothetical protein